MDLVGFYSALLSFAQSSIHHTSTSYQIVSCPLQWYSTYHAWQITDRQSCRNRMLELPYAAFNCRYQNLETDQSRRIVVEENYELNRRLLDDPTAEGLQGFANLIKSQAMLLLDSLANGTSRPKQARAVITTHNHSVMHVVVSILDRFTLTIVLQAVHVTDTSAAASRQILMWARVGQPGIHQFQLSFADLYNHFHLIMGLWHFAHKNLIAHQGFPNGLLNAHSVIISLINCANKRWQM